MGSESVDQRRIEVGDSDEPRSLPHAVVLWHNTNQYTTINYSTAELHDLVNKCVQRLYEIGDLEWVVA